MRGWLVTILALSISPLCTYPQDTLSGKVSYEGQKVDRIELVADPRISVDSFRVA
jgi:hypothetical protein